MPEEIMPPPEGTTPQVDETPLSQDDARRLKKALVAERTSRKQLEKEIRGLKHAQRIETASAIDAATAEVAEGARAYVAELEKGYQERLQAATRETEATRYRAHVSRAARAAGLLDNDQAEAALLAHLDAQGLTFGADPVGAQEGEGLFAGSQPADGFDVLLTSTPALASHVRDLTASTARPTAPSDRPEVWASSPRARR